MTKIMVDLLTREKQSGVTPDGRKGGYFETYSCGHGMFTHHTMPAKRRHCIVCEGRAIIEQAKTPLTHEWSTLVDLVQKHAYVMKATRTRNRSFKGELTDHLDDARARDLILLLTRYAENVLGYTVSFCAPKNRYNGQCQYSRRRIWVRNTNPLLMQLSTLIHEIAHVWHLGAIGKKKMQLEVEAESTAALVLMRLGFSKDVIAKNANYIAGYCLNRMGTLDKAQPFALASAEKILSSIESALPMAAESR